MSQKITKGEKREMKKIKYISISLALITTLVLGIIIGRAQVFGSIIYIMGGVYPGAPSYTIWRDGSNYYAKNAFGQIMFSGTNASEIITNGISADSKILLKSGLYELDSTITKTVDNVVIEGEGNTTILKIDDATSINAFTLTTVNCWIIKSLQIDGNYLNNPYTGNLRTGHGIYITGNSSNIIVEETFIHHTEGCGVKSYYISGQTNINYNLRYINNHISYTLQDGISIGYTDSNVKVLGNVLVYCNIAGYHEYSSIMGGKNGILISNNLILNSGKDGIEGYGIKNYTVVNNIIRDSQRMGIYVTSTEEVSITYFNCIISNNIVEHSGNNVSEAWRYGIKLSARFSLVTSNTVIESYGVGIYIDSFADESVVTNNIIKETNGYGISIFDVNRVVVSNNVIADNTNYGIVLDDSNYTAVVTNVLKDNGISISNSNYGVISYNLIDGGTSNFGIWIASGTDYNILGGNNVQGTTHGITAIEAPGTCSNRIFGTYNLTTWITTWGTG